MREIDSNLIKSISGGVVPGCNKCGTGTGACLVGSTLGGFIGSFLSKRLGVEPTTGAAIGAGAGILVFSGAARTSIGKAVIYKAYNQISDTVNTVWDFASNYDSYFFTTK